MKDEFPTWFGRREESTTPWTAASRNVHRPHGDYGSHCKETFDASSPAVCSSNVPERKQSATRFPLVDHRMRDVLAYIKQTFDNDKALDDLPLECASNPGAWKAWRTYRVKNARSSKNNFGCARESGNHNAEHSPTRQPDEWSWDGVWQERVQKGIRASLSDQVLYGSITSDDPVCL